MRFVGIDLGTTNCALAFTDGKRPSAVFPVLQWESRDAQVAAPTLPSFLYLPPESEGVGPRVGIHAREELGRLPGRVVQSAKSWLCHPTVDRTSRLLPWGSAEVPPAEKLSPVEASTRYLIHLKEAWEREHGDLAEATVVLTVPASFDESAQALTLEAARLAGLPKDVRLLEEPQAAFYFWLEGRGLDEWKALLPSLAERPQRVLVCDIGGGTTDLSLFEILPPEPRQRIPRINRVSVSDHLLLGGDNLDLALAHRLEEKFQAGGHRLSPRQWTHLVHRCRALKERILGTPGESGETFPVSLPGEGARLIQGTLSASLTRSEVEREILEGFFPEARRDDRPRRGQPGLKELGLPYAVDGAVTRHLAAFLDGREVDAVLFNGGSLKPAFLRDRLLDQLERWQGRRPVELENPEMDLAVARGAAVYASLLRKPSGRIRGGYPHSVYLYLERPEGAPALLCLLPKGAEPGDKRKISAEQRFRLLVDQPVRFQLAYSNRREGDGAGDFVDWNEDDFHRLPPLQTEVTWGGREPPPDGRVEVTLEAGLSETGLLALYCVHRPARGKPERWELTFNLRRREGEDADVPAASAADLGVPESRLEAARERIRFFYGGKKVSDPKDSPKSLKRDLERILGQGMDDWNLALLRALFDALGTAGRGRSPEHERTHLYLAGFCLRPGYGAELDPWRVAELWRFFPQGPLFPNVPANVVQWWILWRRISGGLDSTQQARVLERLLPKIQNRNDNPAEVILMAGALERAPAHAREALGEALTRQLVRKKVTTFDQHLWALGRVASRVPVYAGPEAVLPPTTVVPWVTALLEKDFSGRPNYTVFLSQACRLTGDLALDVPEEVRRRATEAMRRAGAPESQLRVVAEVVPVSRSEQARLFGEALPLGLELTGETGPSAGSPSREGAAPAARGARD